MKNIEKEREKAVNIFLDNLRKRLMKAAEFTIDTKYGTNAQVGAGFKIINVYNGRDTITIKIDGGANER